MSKKMLSLDKKFGCCECPCEENCESELRAHISSKHCGYLPFKCFICLTSLPSRNSFEPTEEKMKEHLWNIHQSKKLEYICEIKESKRDLSEEILKRCLELKDPVDSSSSSPTSIVNSIQNLFPVVGISSSVTQAETPLAHGSSTTGGCDLTKGLDEEAVNQPSGGTSLPSILRSKPNPSPFLDVISSVPSAETPLACGSLTTGCEQTFLPFANLQNEAHLKPIIELPPSGDPSDFPIEHMLATLSYVDPSRQNSESEESWSITEPKLKRMKLSTAILETGTSPSKLISLDQPQGTEYTRKLKKKVVPIILKSRKKIHSPSSINGSKLPVISNFPGNTDNSSPTNFKPKGGSVAFDKMLSSGQRLALTNCSKLQVSEKDSEVIQIISFSLGNNVSSNPPLNHYCQISDKPNVNYSTQPVVINNFSASAGTSTSSTILKSDGSSDTQSNERSLELYSQPMLQESEKDNTKVIQSFNLGNKVTDKTRSVGGGNPFMANFGHPSTINFELERNSGALSEMQSNKDEGTSDTLSITQSLQESERNCTTEVINSNLDIEVVADCAQKKFCQKCDKLIVNASKRQHIIYIHLEKAVDDHGYDCKYCNYTDSYTYKMLDHLYKYHKGAPVEYVSRIEEYEDEIKQLLEECFGTNRGERQLDDGTEFPSTSSEFQDEINYSGLDSECQVVNTMVKQIFTKCQKLEEESKKGSVEIIKPLNLGSAASDPSQKQSGHYCLKCQKFIGNFKTQHIIRVHLGNRVYSCKYCDYADRTCNVLNHIRRNHKGMPLEYVSKMKEYQEEIKELLKVCFRINRHRQQKKIVTDPPQKQSGHYCLKCQKSFGNYKTQHVLRAHLQNPIYCCKYCDYADRTCNVLNHIRRNHNGMPLEYVSKTKEFQDEIKQLVEECFGSKRCEHQSEDHTAEQASSTVRSDNIDYCFKCKNQLLTTTKRVHILQVHLKEDVYLCKYCDYAHQYSLGNLLDHIRFCHKGMPLKYKNRSGEYQEKINSLAQQCYHMNMMKQETTYNKKKSDEKKRKLNVKTANVCHGTALKCKHFYCLKCQNSSTSKLRHILQIHLKRDIYVCKYCNYTNQYSKWRTLQHIRCTHKEMPPEYVSRIGEYLDDIDKLGEECYGMHKMNPETNFNKRKLKDKKKRLNVETRSSLKANSVYCRKCQKSFTEKRRHLLQAHLEKDVYICKYCDYTNQYHISGILSHVRCVHKEMPLEYTNRTGEFEDEIKKLEQECFKNSNVCIGSGLKSKLFYCLMCQHGFTKKRQHILQIHLKQDIYICKYCDYVNQYSVKRINYHVRHMHKEMAPEFKNRIEEYKDEIQQFEEDCYGMHKMKYETSCSKRKMKGKKRRINVETLNGCHGSGLKSKRFYCLKCQKSFTDKRRHLLQIHLQRDVYICKYCDYTNQYSKSCIIYHVRHTHKDMPLEYKSRIEEYEDEIKKVEQECFKTSTVAIRSSLKSKLFYCLKCQHGFTNKRQHILQNHLKQDIYICKYCDYVNQYSAKRINYHIRHMHKEMPLEFNNRIEEYKDEIQKFEEECYGMHKMKYETSCSKRKMKEKKRRINVETLNRCHGSGLKSKRFYCLKCQKSFTDKRRHLLQIHLQRNVYICKYCDYTNQYSMSCILYHVKHIHKDMSLEYKNNIAEYGDEIKKLEEECFGFKMRNKRKCCTSTANPGSQEEKERLYCLKCQMSFFFSYKRLHVLQAHLKKDIYLCKYCDYSNQYLKTSMLRHIGVHHKGMPVEFVDKLKEYKNEIDRQVLVCYGLKKAKPYMTCTWCNKRFKTKGFAHHQKACKSKNKPALVNTKNTSVGDDDEHPNTVIESEQKIVDVDEFMAVVKQELEPVDDIDDYDIMSVVKQEPQPID